MVTKVDVRGGEDVLFIGKDDVAQIKLLDVGEEYMIASIYQQHSVDGSHLTVDEDWDKFMELVKEVDAFIKENKKENK